MADLGGTHCRLACLSAGGFTHPQTVQTAIWAGPLPLLRAYLDGLPADRRPDRGAIAIAGPVIGDQVGLTNATDPAWRFSLEELRAALGWRRLRAVNDFTAVALSLPHLANDHLLELGGDGGDPTAPLGVLGPGTGLGVSGLIPVPGGGWRALSGEGGHVSLAAWDDDEARLLSILRAHHGHVSAERVLSGPGLVDLAQAMAERDGLAFALHDPGAITALAVEDDDPFCHRVVNQFCGFLGGMAGDLALTLGATGGVYLAGGILPRMAKLLPTSPFRRRFEDKGRMAEYLASIPSRLVIHPQPAFPGLAALLAEE